jgi:hypothetical protein
MSSNTGFLLDAAGAPGGDDEKYHDGARLQLPASRHFHAKFNQNRPLHRVMDAETNRSYWIVYFFVTFAKLNMSAQKFTNEAKCAAARYRQLGPIRSPFRGMTGKRF